MAAIIGTWKMSLTGVTEAMELLNRGINAGNSVVHAVKRAEDEPSYTSVGYGGLPDREGQVTLDAAFMDGNTLRLGGVIGVRNVANPILAARLLCGRERDCLLSGAGAESFARSKGLEMKDMRTEAAVRRYREALQAERRPDSGHDTVCVIALDDLGGMAVGVSTSGSFMKASGRVGDTPLVGSGFYCDARYGGAAATGLGEEIMRGCLSYETVSLMRRGAAPEDACREALDVFMSARRKAGEEGYKSISLIALSPSGTFGAATTRKVFPFTAGINGGTVLYGVSGGIIRPMTQEELAGED